MAVDTATEALRERANRLYWTSSDTVDGVAEKLGMSRHALYAAVRPAPAGQRCAVCGKRLVYTNRSNRAASLATCSGCGRQVNLAERGAKIEAAAAAEGAREVVFTPAHVERRPGREGGVRDALRSVPPRRVATVAGALTLGALAGVVAVRAAGRYA